MPQPQKFELTFRAARWNPEARLSESPVAVKLEARQQKFNGALGTSPVAPSPPCADKLDFTSACFYQLYASLLRRLLG